MKIAAAQIHLYPDVELALHFVDSEDGVKGVESGQLELAIITLPASTGKARAVARTEASSEK